MKGNLGLYVLHAAVFLSVVACKRDIREGAAARPPAVSLPVPGGAVKELKAAAVMAGYTPCEGDLIFQSLPRTPLVDAIEGSSGSPFSHCGIVRSSADSGWAVLEAIGPVKTTPFRSWVLQSRDGRFTVYRLKERWRSKIPEFIRAADSYKGRPYDIHYDMDDSRIYCSELIWKAFRQATGEELGRLQALGELNWKPYRGLIERIENGKLPLERQMITPRSLSEAPQLEKIFTKEG